MNVIHESTGCYALDALDEAELAQFEGHLAACLSCSHEVASFYEAAAELAMLVEATPPPPALRDTIVTAVRATPQLQAEETVQPTPHRHPAGPRRALVGSEGPDDWETPDADELALRRQSRRNRLLTGLVAAMLAVLVGLGGVVYTLVQQRSSQLAQVNLEKELYGAPDTQTVVVDVSGGGQATFVVSKQLNRALFIGTGLPEPGPDKRYQLWTMTGQEPKWKTATSVSRDSEITDPGSGGKVFLRGDIAKADFLCLNLEPLGNNTNKPTVPPLAAAAI